MVSLIGTGSCIHVAACLHGYRPWLAALPLAAPRPLCCPVLHPPAQLAPLNCPLAPHTTSVATHPYGRRVPLHLPWPPLVPLVPPSATTLHHVCCSSHSTTKQTPATTHPLATMCTLGRHTHALSSCTPQLTTVFFLKKKIH